MLAPSPHQEVSASVVGLIVNNHANCLQLISYFEFF